MFSSNRFMMFCVFNRWWTLLRLTAPQPALQMDVLQRGQCHSGGSHPCSTDRCSLRRRSVSCKQRRHRQMLANASRMVIKLNLGCFHKSFVHNISYFCRHYHISLAWQKCSNTAFSVNTLMAFPTLYKTWYHSLSAFRWVIICPCSPFKRVNMLMYFVMCVQKLCGSTSA